MSFIEFQRLCFVLQPNRKEIKLSNNYGLLFICKYIFLMLNTPYTLCLNVTFVNSASTCRLKTHYNTHLQEHT